MAGQLQQYNQRQAASPFARPVSFFKLDFYLVINDCLDRLAQQSILYDTVRGAFLEGAPAYAGAGFSRKPTFSLPCAIPLAFSAFSFQTCNMNSPTPEEVAREAREALEKSPETPQEHFDRLVSRGWINLRGEVTRLLGGDAEPEATPTVRRVHQQHPWLP